MLTSSGHFTLKKTVDSEYVQYGFSSISDKDLWLNRVTSVSEFCHVILRESIKMAVAELLPQLCDLCLS